MVFLRCSTKPKNTVAAAPGVQKKYILKVARGAFHYNSFILKSDTLHYIPEEKANHPNPLYNKATTKVLDSAVVRRFINKIVQDGFWELNASYESSSTCTSRLRITLEADEQIKTVTCDDFERDCPELIKFIDQKVVELEGNGLVRIYLPG